MTARCACHWHDDWLGRSVTVVCRRRLSRWQAGPLASGAAAPWHSACVLRFTHWLSDHRMLVNPGDFQPAGVTRRRPIIVPWQPGP
eukprot:232092-Hanusia_phi.AAC.1